MIPMFFIVSSAGLAFPNAPAIALNRHAETAGTAAALLGASQFLVGGAIAPLVGLLDNGTAVPMAAIIVGTPAWPPSCSGPPAPSSTACRTSSHRSAESTAAMPTPTQP